MNGTEHPTQLGTPRPPASVAAAYPATPASVAAAYPATAPSLVVQWLHCHLRKSGESVKT